MVKIVEFTDKEDTKLPFDVVEDVVVFMRNDPVFYRKHYYPAIANLADIHRSGEKINKSVLGSMVDNGCNSYCKKFNLGRKPADVFTADDRHAIINKITSEELKNIKNGDY